MIGRRWKKEKASPTHIKCLYFSFILYFALSVILNVYLMMLRDLLSFLGLMFAKHPVTSTSTDNFLLAAKLPMLTHCLETPNRITKGLVPQQWAPHKCVGSPWSQDVLSGRENEEGLWSWKLTWNSGFSYNFCQKFQIDGDNYQNARQ